MRSHSIIKRDAVLLNSEKNAFKYGAFSKYLKNNNKFRELEFDDFSNEIDL